MTDHTLAHRFEILDTHPVDGRRYPLTPGAVCTVAGRRGIFRIHEIRQWDNGHLEAVAWWRSSATAKDPLAQWAAIDLTTATITTIKP